MMSRLSSNAQPAAEPAEDIEAQIARIASMNIAEARAEWGRRFACEPPPALTRSLIVRAIACRMQEEALGGLSTPVARALRSLSKSDIEPSRQIKIGSVIVREHRNVLHEVLVTPGGFCWQGERYGSLSTIAKKITGVSWSGPRFFGLRAQKASGKVSTPASDPTHSDQAESNEVKGRAVAARNGRCSSGGRSDFRIG